MRENAVDDLLLFNLGDHGSYLIEMANLAYL